MRSLRLVIPIAALAIASCGKEEQGSPSTPSTPKTAPAPAAPDNSPAQEALGEQVLVSIERVGTTLSQIKDEQTAKQAAVEIGTIGEELNELAEKMRLAGTPTADLADRFRSRVAESQRTQQAQLEQSIQTLQAKPDTVIEINRALQALEDTRANGTFEAYGF